MADLDKTMSRLLVSSKTTSVVSTPPSGGVSNNQVDEFLREALQNPRERLSILRIEQDVVKFISNPSQQQLEFQQLPTSYLRLAAHRVAQHYQLESLGVLDNNVHDGFGSRIVVRKSSACQFPPIRLADIPLSLPHGDNNGSVKVAIKQRPGKCSESANNASRSSKWNHAKSVEERKEEYNRARARIFSSENGTKGDNVKALQPCSLRSKGVDERFIVQGPESPSKGYDSSTGRCRTEHDPAGRYKTNNKVAIFRDRDVDRKDPDYDRSYDRFAVTLLSSQVVEVAPSFMQELEWSEANGGSSFLESLYKALDEVVKLPECEIYSYSPDSDGDPFLEKGAIWSFNFFFYNRKLKRVVSVRCCCLSNLAADGFTTDGPYDEEDDDIFHDMDM